MGEVRLLETRLPGRIAHCHARARALTHPSLSPRPLPPPRRLDKRRFFINGAGIFTGLTSALFPLTVIKTRMMAMDGAHTGLRGAVLTAREVVHHDGLRGLYKGFGTVLCGLIPARMLYLAALESTKFGVSEMLSRNPRLTDTFVASSASFVAGGVASMAGQLVVVPIDVVSQRLMIMGGGAPAVKGVPQAAPHPRVNGLDLARQIIRREGFFGLYRGFGASVATFVPSSAIWWASYGGWQSFLWRHLESFGVVGAADGAPRPSAHVVGVQLVAGVLTGCTSAAITNPLDVVKTRIQTQRREAGELPKPTWRGTAASLLRAEGPSGFLRGVAPRMVSTSIWGTAMVTTYEFLKRLCVLPDPEVDALLRNEVK